jgi:hypothetical protein
VTAAVDPLYVLDAAFGGFTLGIVYCLVTWHYFGPNRNRRRERT